MAIKEELKDGLTLVGNTINDIAEILAEKSKIRAQSARVKQIIKADTQTRDNAYIELGKFYYENMRDNASEEHEAYCKIIDKMSARIEKASIKFVELQNLQNSTKIQSENGEKLKEMFVKKAEQVKEEAGEKAKATATAAWEKTKDVATNAWETTSNFATEKYNQIKNKVEGPVEAVEDTTEAVVETAEDTVDAVKDKATEIKNIFNNKPLTEEQINDILEEKVEAPVATTEIKIEITPEENRSNEETPESFDF